MYDRLGNLYAHGQTNPMSNIGEAHLNVAAAYTYKDASLLQVKGGQDEVRTR
jgi:hypothetical protein